MAAEAIRVTGANQVKLPAPAAGNPGQVIQLAGGAAVSAGAGQAYAAGDLVTWELDGVWKFPTGGATLSAGAIQWDNTGKVLASTGDFGVGRLLAATGASDTHGLVLLNGVVVP